MGVYPLRVSLTSMAETRIQLPHQIKTSFHHTTRNLELGGLGLQWLSQEVTRRTGSCQLPCSIYPMKDFHFSVVRMTSPPLGIDLCVRQKEGLIAKGTLCGLNLFVIVRESQLLKKPHQ